MYWYTTAFYAKQLGVEVHMVQVLSTHIHEVLTDRRGNLPRFFELRNAMLVNALKRLRKWPGEMLSREEACWVEIPTAAAAVQEMAYTAANCVAAGLVSAPSKWPGAKVLVGEVGRAMKRAKRPEFYFSAEYWPDEVSIPIEMPELLDKAYETADEARKAVRERLKVLVSQAKRGLAKLGRRFAGAKQVLRSTYTKRATSEEPDRERKPKFAADGDAKVVAAMLDRCAAFHRAYRAAWEKWREGDHDVRFPAGTWKLRVTHAARCRPHPT